MDGTTDQASNPLWSLPADDPRCVNSSCQAFNVGFQDDQQRYSNNLFPFYATWAVYFYTATILVFAFVYVHRLLTDGGKGTRLKQQALACWRMFTYRRLGGKAGERVDVSYGQLALFIIATIFIAILPFFQGYYLRQLFRYGSPPLSVRCAFLISALLPICIALAGKVNIVSILTGISYAKLNIWHRYVAYVIYCLTIVHLVPHLLAPIREGGYAELANLLKTKHRELSGIVLEFTFTLMILSSIPWVRARFYEAFKIFHILLAICFVIFLFWHIDGEYITPDYYWATAAVLVGNFVARGIYRSRLPSPAKEFFRGFPTTLEALPGNMTRVVVQCPQQLRWQPGQHCYITMPGISKLQSHPFTIVSLSQHLSYPGPNDLVLLIRACKGFTKTVADMAVKNFPSRSGSFSESNSITLTSPDTTIEPPTDAHSSLRSWIDGPYGDFQPQLELRYQGVFCIAGGSGITSGLPWLVYLASRMRLGAQDRRGPHGDKLCRTRTLHLIWSIKHLSWIRWAERELSEVLRDVMMANMPSPRKSTADIRALVEPKTLRLKISIFVTQPVSDTEMKAAMLELFLGAGVDVYNPHARVEILRGRPDYSNMLPNMMDRKRNIVLTCGPQSQKISVANSVAKLQGMVLSRDAQEIALHSETFGW